MAPGTIFAPELCLKHAYDYTVDVWAMGVVMYCILAGFHPFDPTRSGSRPEVLERITTGQFDFEHPVWRRIDIEVE